MFHMIEAGTVVVANAVIGPEPKCVLKTETSFVKKALLSSNTRATTCTATSKLKYFVLACEDFTRMLENLKKKPSIQMKTKVKH